jgi:hypothetical protein
VVRVPGGLDTGIVFNTAPGFTVSAGGVSDSARFIFATLVGTISGWSPNVPLNGDAQLKATVQGAAFTGLANLTTAQGSFLYAADFAGGRIDAFDPRDGGFRGTLRDEQGRAIVNDRLWALRFGNGVFGGPTDLVVQRGHPERDPRPARNHPGGRRLAPSPDPDRWGRVHRRLEGRAGARGTGSAPAPPEAAAWPWLAGCAPFTPP